MRYEKFEEPIEVIVHFTGAGIKPLRFLWQGVAHRVENVRGRWTTWDGLKQCRHFAVNAGGVGNCEIAFNVDTMKWQIDTVIIDN